MASGIPSTFFPSLWRFSVFFSIPYSKTTILSAASACESRRTVSTKRALRCPRGSNHVYDATKQLPKSEKSQHPIPEEVISHGETKQYAAMSRMSQRSIPRKLKRETTMKQNLPGPVINPKAPSRTVFAASKSFVFLGNRSRSFGEFPIKFIPSLLLTMEGFS